MASIEHMHLYLLMLVVISDSFVSREIGAPLISIMGFLVLLAYGVDRSLLKLITPIIMVLFIGVISLIVNYFIYNANYQIRDILRDFLYSTTPVACLLIGYFAAKNDGRWTKISKTAIMLGVVMAFYHLSAFVANPGLILEEPMKVRDTAGNIADIVLISFLIIIFQRRFDLNSKKYYYIALILFTSIYLSYSRTSMIVLLLFYFSMSGIIGRINFKFVFSILLLFLSYYWISEYYVDSNDYTITSRIFRIFSEMAISDYDSMSEININWRGFETYKTISQYLNGDAIQLIVGQGFGTLVDLGLNIDLGGGVGTGTESSNYRYIPITHNGYAYIILKFGLAGIFGYIYFFYILIKKIYVGIGTEIGPALETRRFLLGLILAVASIMSVGMGMAQMTNLCYLYFIGYFYRRVY